MRKAGIGNSAKTLGLFALMWVLLMMVGGGIAWGTGDALWLWVFAGVGVISTFVTYWNSATLALRQMHAYEVGPEQAPALHAMVNELSATAGMPPPTVWIAPTQSPNAFATGRNPGNAAVCFTEGILQLLDERELRGVLAHELMHVYNRDILTASVASAMAGVISTVAQFGIMFGRRDDRGRPQSFLAVLVAPLIAQVVQLGISRTREYDADADGALLTGDPMGLASALQKISGTAAVRPMASTPDTQQVAAMMIANPFRGMKVAGLFSSHPPMEERVGRLTKMAQSMGSAR